MDAKTLASCTGARIDRARLFADPITSAMERFSIDQTIGRQAAFLATASVESDKLEDEEECLSYSSADRLRQIFPSLFNPAKGGMHNADAYVRNPDGLSALRYGGYHGRGLIQLTWRENYKAAGDALGYDYVGHPDMVLEPEHAAMTAAWFFASFKNLLPFADRGDMDTITLRVNGPARLKLKERKDLMKLVLEVLA